MKSLLMNIMAVVMAMVCVTCSGTTIPSDSNTVVTADYFGERERTNGIGWNHPEELEMALSMETRPLIVIFSATWCGPCKTLKKLIIKKEWRDKLLIVDIDIPENEARAILLRVPNSVPSLVFINNNEEKIILSGYWDIAKFLQGHFDKRG